MWRQAINVQDMIDILLIMEASDPTSYQASARKGFERRAQILANRDLNDPNMAYWIYEDGDAKGVVVMNRYKGCINNFCATGFDPDIFQNEVKSMPILGDKVREIADAWGMTKFYSDCPRTLKGEAQAKLAAIHAWEATVTLSDDQEHYHIEYNRSGVKPVDEKYYKVVRTDTLIQPDAMPKDYVPKDLVASADPIDIKPINGGELDVQKP